MKSVEPITIDSGFDVDLANELAEFESYNKHLYRPNTYLHKWWARRCGTTFRLILKHLVTRSDQRNFYAPGGLEGKIVLDPMMGGGTTLHEAIRLGANVVGVDIDPIPVLQARASLSSIDLLRLEQAFTKFYDPLQRDLAPLYHTACPVCGKTVESQYMLYGLEKSCSCSTAIFVDSYSLRHNPDGSVFHIDPYEQHILLDGRIFSPAGRSHTLRLLEKTTRQCEKCHMRFEEDVQQPTISVTSPLRFLVRAMSMASFFVSTRGRSWAH